MKFVHTHNHSSFSIGDGLSSIKDWVKAIKEMGLSGHALTDHGSMAGCLSFHGEMRKEGLTPILGCEFYFVRDIESKDRKSSHMILLAKDFSGWQNLLALQKFSHTDGFYYRPRIDLRALKSHSEGLICLTACVGGVLGKQAFMKAEGVPCEGVVWWAKLLRKIFKDDFYVEYQPHKPDLQVAMNEIYYNLLPDFKSVVTNDCHYILPEHFKVQEILKAGSFKRVEAVEEGNKFDTCYLMHPREILTNLKKHHSGIPIAFFAEAMRNTWEIYEKCVDFKFPTARHYLPTYRSKSEFKKHGAKSSSELFKALTTSAFKSFIKSGRWEGIAPKSVYVERFLKEYKLISKYKLEDYFLIIWDILAFAKKNGIYFGVGRGSAASSLVLYLLDIVKLDPIEYKLIFERFLNEIRCETGELPDCDLDFESDRRQEIKDYIFEKYGHDKVCEIGTYGRLKLKSSIIDFGKHFGFDHTDLLKMTKSLNLDKDEDQSLDAAMDACPELDAAMKANPDFDFSVRTINGQIKTQGIHPAGVIISSQPYAEVTPVKSQKLNKKERVAKEGDRILVTQSEDKYVMSQGLIKMDILGIKEYDIFKSTIENSDCGLTADNYIDAIHDIARAKTDKKVWKMFQDGETDGVFQFSSDVMKELLRNVSPERLSDLMAVTSLGRPACLANDFHTRFWRRKQGLEEPEYIHDCVKEHFEDTFGVIIYQEQFLQTAHLVAGLPMAESDILRSAMGKKKADVMATFEDRFVKGATKTLKSKKKAAGLWKQFKQAAEYGFNSSHAAAYSLVAYISQHFKVHYPNEFWASVLTWDARKNMVDNLIKHKSAATRMGVGVKLPSLEESDVDFKSRDGIVYWGLRGIKKVGEGAAREIVSKRPFHSIADFYDRINKSKCRFDMVLNLAYAGVFDAFGERNDVLEELYSFRPKEKFKRLSRREFQTLFYDVLGTFEIPLKIAYPFTTHCFSESELGEVFPGEPVAVGGMIMDLAVFKDKNENRMAKARLVDVDQSIDVTFFSKEWAVLKVKERDIVEIFGTKSDWGGGNSVDVNDLKLFS